jgi:hypothetical protein
MSDKKKHLEINESDHKAFKALANDQGMKMHGLFTKMLKEYKRMLAMRGE